MTFGHLLPKAAFLPRLPLLFGAGTLLAIAIGFLIHHILWPPCCDADYYVDLAGRYNAEGLASVKEPLRTFAYPLGLSLALALSRILGTTVLLPVFIVQLAAYYLATLAVANVVAEKSGRLSVAIYLALCANIFVIPYASVTITDSLYTSLALMLLTWGMKTELLSTATEPVVTRRWILVGVFLLSLAIEVRPAAIWLVVPTLIYLFRLLVRVRVSIASTFLVVAIGAIPLYVQVVLNVMNYGTVTIFPVTDLQKQQIVWGIENIKYGTWLGGSVVNNFYPARGLVAVGSGPLDVGWYFENLLEAVKLLGLKLVGAFDFDYLTPYPYRKTPLKWAASLVSFSIFSIGLFGIALHLVTGKLVALGARYMPLVIFVSWCAVSLVSALELRFTLPLVTYLIVVACAAGDLLIRTGSRRLALLMASSWVVSMPLLFLVARLIRQQSVLQ